LTHTQIFAHNIITIDIVEISNNHCTVGSNAMRSSVKLSNRACKIS